MARSQSRNDAGAPSVTWLLTAWRWFLSTSVGRWIVGIGAVLLGVLALAYTAFLKGKHAQATKDQAKDAEAAQRAAQAAQQTFTAATDAATKVQAAAAKQPPPDTVKRDDLDTDF